MVCSGRQRKIGLCWVWSNAVGPRCYTPVTEALPRTKHFKGKNCECCPLSLLKYSGRHGNSFGNVFKIALNRARPGQHESKSRITLVVWENSPSQFQHFGVSSCCSFQLSSTSASAFATSPGTKPNYQWAWEAWVWGLLKTTPQQHMRPQLSHTF